MCKINNLKRSKKRIAIMGSACMRVMLPKRCSGTCFYRKEFVMGITDSQYLESWQLKVKFFSYNILFLNIGNINKITYIYFLKMIDLKM